MQARTVRLAAAIAGLRDRFGSHIIRYAAELATLPVTPDQPALSTGSLGLDLLVGGLPRGGLIEYAGSDGSGRETLAATALARVQQNAGLVLLVDPGCTADPDALVSAGITLTTLTIVSPMTAAQAWATLSVLSRCGALDLILVSSLSSLLLLPGADRAGRLERALSRLWIALRGRRTAVLVTNTLLAGTRRSVGEQALQQTALLRVLLESSGVGIGPAGELTGLRSLAHVTKHHGRPWDPPLELLIGACGPDRACELLALARLTERISATAQGLYGCGRVLGRSEARAQATLREDSALAAALEAEIRAAWPPRVPFALEAGAG